jgi:opacity protein-like surface antigen
LSKLLGAVLAAVSLGTGSVGAQNVEVAPFGGYRFGGGFYELATRAEVDVDGAPSFGGLLDVRIGDDLFVEGLFTHQQARFTLPPSLDASQIRRRVTVDHWQVGGLRELRPGRARPFLTGAVGLTRFESEGDDEIRFSLSAGGGVKLYPTERIALRLDGRGHATFVDGEVDELFCTPGFCIGTLDVSVVWQADLTAALVFAF